MLSTPPRVPRLTLLWGGAGIVAATVVPLAWQVFHLVPPTGWERLNWAWESFSTTASAAVLLAAFTVLAVGVRRESGIAGSSIAGNVALIGFAVVGLAVNLYNYVPPDSFLSPMRHLTNSDYSGVSVADQQTLARAIWILEGVVYLGHAALVVASVFVIRAHVLRGAARWGLAALALATVVVDLLWHAAFGPELSIRLLSQAQVVVPLIQLLVGVVFLLQARSTRVSGVTRSVLSAG
ncbi:hypothetical protein [Gryllotalpicola protaetiae]|uniref:DUF4386 domain-containing protein n=1 Tax=Gryllotalpicola protaetiae TaxID=2419771 RepID=A0A387BL45_9MICO|nr:hypothetical protein [Gryllotalpicola protaetiae]AYG03378.1 hypothetical protein D7I44_07425 [Gryllotalpicola protaetiae]